MFEYTFIGLQDERGTFDHKGETTDFLEVCCQITELFSPLVTGQFTRELMETKSSDLPFLRVVDWKFEYTLPETSQIIRLHMHKRA